VAAAGRTITGTVGGASGALYGRALMRVGEVLAAGADEAPDEDRPGSDAAPDSLVLAMGLEAAVESIMRLGRSRPGEKTMLDALAPAAEALRRGADAGHPLATAAEAAALAAEAGAESTIPMLATKGRASYLGERSIGHLDPGAASSAILLRALSDAAAEA
jgi:dihydroxyacetone kinase-like protein